MSVNKSLRSTFKASFCPDNMHTLAHICPVENICMHDRLYMGMGYMKIWSRSPNGPLVYFQWVNYQMLDLHGHRGLIAWSPRGEILTCGVHTGIISNGDVCPHRPLVSNDMNQKWRWQAAQHPNGEIFFFGVGVHIGKWLVHSRAEQPESHSCLSRFVKLTSWRARYHCLLVLVVWK